MFWIKYGAKEICRSNHSDLVGVIKLKAGGQEEEVYKSCDSCGQLLMVWQRLNAAVRWLLYMTGKCCRLHLTCSLINSITGIAICDFLKGVKANPGSYLDGRDCNVHDVVDLLTIMTTMVMITTIV